MARHPNEQHTLNLLSDPSVPTDNIIHYVKEKCRDIPFGPQTLGMLFERIAGVTYNEDDPMSCFSREFSVDMLADIHPGFRSTNGCQWARSDTSYLGKRYIIVRGHKGRKVSTVKLDGANNKSIKRNRSIKKEIVDEVQKQRCVILDVSTQIEVDHKDGHYDVLANQSIATQKLSDFQPLSKAANDAKRNHCKRCIETGKRYDATKLGYSQSFIVGDENTSTCQGCYWYDPQYFNKIISAGYKKEK
ncbi:MAG: hypothetical protein IJT16_15500 [Lachnospiraceae bacterium]|nr:hypothetical protein [Lachnospiraceae bacterium]